MVASRRSPGQRLRVVAIAIVTLLAGVAIAVLPVKTSGATTQTATFTTAGEFTYSVDPGTTSLQVTVRGAAGSSVETGGAPPASPGAGALIVATIPPPYSSTLYVEVGDAGGHGGGGLSQFGGRGGGESDIQTCSVSNLSCTYSGVPGSDPRLVVAGGGGGGAEDSFPLGHGNGGNGGNAGVSSAVGGPGAGGSGTDSGNGVAGSDATMSNDATSAAAGPASANCTPGAGTVGTAGSGGHGGDHNGGNSADGGGGGSGWIGGSGGGAGACPFGVGNGGGGGGGAGSSFIESGAAPLSVSAGGTSITGEVIITATIVNAPVFTSADTTSATYGSPFSFPVTTTGDLPMTIGLGSGTLPGGVTLTDNGDGTATLAGDASVAAGMYNFTLQAANGITTPQPFTLDVAQAAQAIAFTSTPPAGAIPQSGIPYLVTATGGGSAKPVVFSIDPASSSVCTISGALVSFIAPGMCVIDANQAGNSNFLAAPQAQQQVEVAGCALPTFTSHATAQAPIGRRLHFSVTTNTDGCVTSLTETGALPRGLKFKIRGGQAVLHGLVKATAGTTTVTLKAVGLFGTATQALSVVVAPGVAPTFSSAATTTCHVGQACNFTVTASGFPTPTLSVKRFPPGPLGFALDPANPNSGSIFGTAGTGDVGTSKLVFSASNLIARNKVQNFSLVVVP